VRIILGGLDDGMFGHVEATRDVHCRAEHLRLVLTETALRAADALHLARATSAHSASMASFDTVWPPRPARWAS
jgi:predicted nucleic acid-binding protein